MPQLLMNTTAPVETVKFSVEVKLADADGKPIKEGSVLQEITDGDRGVVSRIFRAGDMGSIYNRIGDLHIYKRPGITRVTNRYNQWRHIPHDKQTIEERYQSWLCRGAFEHDPEWSKVSKDAALLMDGIMALLPEDCVDDDFGPWPDTVEGVLEILKNHLQKLESNK